MKLVKRFKIAFRWYMKKVSENPYAFLITGSMPIIR